MNTLSKMLYAIGERVHKLENKDMPTTVKINNGGTGATTAPAARKNLLEDKPLSVAEGGTSTSSCAEIRKNTAGQVDKFHIARGMYNFSRNQPILFTDRAKKLPHKFFNARSNGHIVYQDNSSTSEWLSWPDGSNKTVRIDAQFTPTSSNLKISSDVSIYIMNGSTELAVQVYSANDTQTNTLSVSAVTSVSKNCDLWVKLEMQGTDSLGYIVPDSIGTNWGHDIQDFSSMLTITTLD